MRISQNGINFIKKHEGCILYAYQNFLKKSNKWDIPTIGYGWTVGVKMGQWHLNSKGNRRCSDTNKITQQQAEQTLVNQVYKFENVVRRYFKGCTLTQGMYDALCSLAWNCGSFNNNLVAAIKANPLSKTTENLFKNHRIGAASVLAKRRISEWELFTSGGKSEELSGPVSGSPFGGSSNDTLATFDGTYNGDINSGDGSSDSDNNTYINYDEDDWDGGEEIEENTAFEGYEDSGSSGDADASGGGEADSSEETTEDPTTAALDSLMESQCSGVNIPGLDIDTILQNFVEKSPQMKSILGATQELLDKIEEKKAEIQAKYDENDEDDATEMKVMLDMLKEETNNIIEQQKKVVDDFIKENKQMVQNKINIIKVSFKSIQDGTTELMSTISSAMTSISLPSFIGTGSPNPARPVADFITIKHQLKAQLSPIITSAVTLLSAAQDIMFSVPAPVTSAINMISTVQSTIDTIPG